MIVCYKVQTVLCTIQFKTTKRYIEAGSTRCSIKLYVLFLHVFDCLFYDFQHIPSIGKASSVRVHFIGNDNKMLSLLSPSSCQVLVDV